METADKIRKLTPAAQSLLLELGKKEGPTNVKGLARFDQAKVMRSALLLEEQGLLEIKEETADNFHFSQKGKEVRDKGLPERNLIELLDSKGTTAIDKLDLDHPSVAVGQAQRKNWISIEKENGTTLLSITDRGNQYLDRETEEEKLISKIESGEQQELAREDVKTLEERGLVEREESSEKILKLTEEGRKLSQQAKEVASVSQLTPELIESGRWQEVELREYDVEAAGSVIRPGKRHPYRRYLDQVKEDLIALGFKEVKTDPIELEFWNFDALFQAQEHPAREIHDKFDLRSPQQGKLEDKELVERIKDMHETGGDLASTGWGYEWSEDKASQLILRSQTTATTIKTLAKGLKTPAKVFTVDRNFRRDVTDSTHFLEFYQMEGIVKAKDLTLRNLLGYLQLFGKEVAGADKVRFRPGYFPFTEPSVELDGYHPRLGWIELGGAGMFRPEVTSPLGVKEPVIAWGLGIDRLAMLKLDKDDIRQLVFPKDLAQLREAKLEP